MDINTIKSSIKTGTSKEEFLDNIAKTKNKEQNFYIYNEEAAIQSAIFDELDSNHNNVIDENELNDLKNINKKDGKNGENIFSDYDLKGIYAKVSDKIKENYGSKTPEEVYKEAINGGSDANTLLQNITFQIETIKGLIDLSQQNSNNIIQKYQDKIDDLVLKAKIKNNNLKEEYINAREKITKLKKNSEKYASGANNDSQNIAEITDNISLLKSEIENMQNSEENNTKIEEKNKELKKLNKTLNKYNKSYSNYISKQQNANSGINGININTILDKIKSEDSNTKSKIEIIELKIETEKNNENLEIESYQAQIKNLTNIQEYTVQQIQSENTEGVQENYTDEDMSNISYDSKALKSKWQNKTPWLSEGFYNKATEVSKRLGCNPNALLGLMMSESGLKSSATNRNGGATGLIQFMPSTARSLGTSTAALKQMSAEQQMVYVEKYLQRAKSSAGFGKNDKLDAGSLYTLTFLPAFARRDVLTTKGQIYYNANAGLDGNKDGKITKKELGQRILKFAR